MTTTRGRGGQRQAQRRRREARRTHTFGLLAANTPKASCWKLCFMSTWRGPRLTHTPHAPPHPPQTGLPVHACPGIYLCQHPCPKPHLVPYPPSPPASADERELATCLLLTPHHGALSTHHEQQQQRQQEGSTLRHLSPIHLLRQEALHHGGGRGLGHPLLHGR